MIETALQNKSRNDILCYLDAYRKWETKNKYVIGKVLSTLLVLNQSISIFKVRNTEKKRTSLEGSYYLTLLQPIKKKIHFYFNPIYVHSHQTQTQQ
jgi:hypothetical protein